MSLNASHGELRNNIFHQSLKMVRYEMISSLHVPEAVYMPE